MSTLSMGQNLGFSLGGKAKCEVPEVKAKFCEGLFQERYWRRWEPSGPTWHC